jgi:hypothetical protein
MSHDGADKRKVDQGRDEAGKSSDNPAIGMDFYISSLVGVFQQPEDARFRERLVVLGVDLNMYLVEFFDDLAHSKGSEISQTEGPFCLTLLGFS